MGYPYGKKRWRLYDLETQQFFISRDVVFYENQFPFALPTTMASSMEKVSNYEDNACWLDEIKATGGIGETMGHSPVMGQKPQPVPLVEWTGEAHHQEGSLRVSGKPGVEGARQNLIANVGEEGAEPHEEGTDGPTMDTQATGHSSQIPAHTEQQPIHSVGQGDSLGRGHQKKEPAIRLCDYVTHTT